MCSDCFEEDHLRGAQKCEGAKTWEEYCAKFEDRWNEEERKKGSTATRKSLLEPQRDKIQKIEEENADLHFHFEQKEESDVPSQKDEEIKRLVKEKQKTQEENEELKLKLSRKTAPEKVKQMEETIKSLQTNMDEHEKEDKKREEEDEKRENMLKFKDEEIKKLKEVIQQQIGGDDNRGKRGLSLSNSAIEESNKNMRHSESITKND